MPDSKYTVWQEGCEEDSQDLVGVFSEDEAAQDGADPDGDMSDGEERIIFVRDQNGKVTKFKVIADMRYIAVEIK